MKIFNKSAIILAMFISYSAVALAQSPPPANDVCSNSMLLPCATDTTSQYTMGALDGAKEEFPADTFLTKVSSTAKDVWYKYTRNGTPQITIKTDTSLRIGIEIYDACGGNRIASKNTLYVSGTQLISIVEQTSFPTATVYVRVYPITPNLSTHSDFSISIHQPKVFGCTGPQITQQPTVPIICFYSTNANYIDLSVGTNQVSSYQWVKEDKNHVVSNLAITTSIHQGFFLSDTSSKYYVIVSDACGNTLKSTVIKPIVYNTTLQKLTTDQDFQHICTQSKLVISKINNAYNPHYAWFKNQTALTDTTDSLVFNPVTDIDITSYKIRVTDGCGRVHNDSILLLKSSSLSSLSQSADTLLCATKPLNLFYHGVGPKKINGTWQNSVYDGTWHKITGVTDSIVNGSFNPLTEKDAGRYFAVLKDYCTTIYYSDTITIAVKSATTSNLPPLTYSCTGVDKVIHSLASGIGALTYQWKHLNTNLGTDSIITLKNIQRSDSGKVYSCTVTGECNSIVKNTKLIVVPNPKPQFTVNQQLFNAPPFNIQLTNTTPSISKYYYLWAFGDGQTSTSVNPSVFHTYNNNGLYSIRLTATDTTYGCQKDTLMKDYINCTGGKDSTTAGLTNINKSELKVLVYPNPTTGGSFISFEFDNSKPLLIQIYNMIGEEVIETDQKRIIIKEPGVFFYRVSQRDGTTTTGKLIVQ